MLSWKRFCKDIKIRKVICRVSAGIAALVAPRPIAVTWYSGTGSQGTWRWRCLSRGVLRVSAAHLLLEFSNKTRSAATIYLLQQLPGIQVLTRLKRMLWETSQVRTFPGLEAGMFWQLQQRLTLERCFLKQVIVEQGLEHPGQHSARDGHSGGDAAGATSLSCGAPGCCPLLAHIPLPSSCLCRPAQPSFRTLFSFSLLYKSQFLQIVGLLQQFLTTLPPLGQRPLTIFTPICDFWGMSHSTAHLHSTYPPAENALPAALLTPSWSISHLCQRHTLPALQSYLSEICRKIFRLILSFGAQSEKKIRKKAVKTTLVGTGTKASIRLSKCYQVSLPP